MTEPTKQDLDSPLFNSVWNVIKGWDIQRNPSEGYAGATGTDVMAILEAYNQSKSGEELVELDGELNKQILGLSTVKHHTIEEEWWRIDNLIKLVKFGQRPQRIANR